jgi:hypothetical protein
VVALLLPLPLLYFCCAIAYGFVLLANFTYVQLRLRFSVSRRAAGL